MAHTIFHSPDRQDIIRRNTPRVSIEAARARRQTARRAILTNFASFERPTAPRAGTGTGPMDRPERGEGALGVAGDIDSFGANTRRRSSLRGLDLPDLASLAFASTTPSVQLASEFATQLAGFLAPSAPLFGAFLGPTAALASAERTLGRTGSTVNTAFGQSFRGTQFGAVEERSLVAGMAGGPDIGTFGPAQGPTRSFSPTYGVDAFGQISGPMSSVAGGFPGSIESAIDKMTAGSIGNISESGVGDTGSGRGESVGDPGEAGGVGMGGGIGL